jgi:adenine-specific DNA glycosylase
VETNLLEVTPKKYLRNAHPYLILPGRYTCLATKPLCVKCPIFGECEFPERKKIAKEQAGGGRQEGKKTKKAKLPKGRDV